MSKTKIKASFSGESLALLRELSPAVAALEPAKDSIEIRAEQLFKDDPGKKGKTAKEKMYIFVNVINLGQGEPLFIQKSFGQVSVRPNVGKAEIDRILNEAGIKNLTRVYERAKAHVLGKSTEGIAPPRPAVQKGKPEHADPFRGPRSFRGRYYGEEPDNLEEEFGQYEEGFADLERPSHMSASERRAQQKRDDQYAEYMRKRMKEMEERLHSFKIEAPRVWAETHPGEPYPPKDPGWQWVPETHSWQYFRPGYNPFYDDSYWSGARGRNNSGPSASARAAAGEGPPAARTCESILAEHGISVTDPKSFRTWALANHPDKGGDEKLFKEVSGCWTTLTKGGTRRNRKHKRKSKKTRKT